MAQSVGELSFLIKSTYDNGGAKAAIADNRALVTAQEQASAKTEAMAGAGTKDSYSSKQLEEDRRVWATRGKLRDEAIKDQVQIENVAKIAHVQALNDQAKADRAYWTERARMRDQDLKDQLQDEQVAKIAHVQAMADQNKVPPTSNAGRSINYGGIASQIGFGLQDFASQVQNSKNTIDGIGRGIGAISNNVQVLGASFGPTGLAVTAIGGALAGIVLPSTIKWLANSEALEKSAKVAADEYDRIADRIEFVSKARFDSKGSDNQENSLRQDATVAKAEQMLQTKNTEAMRRQNAELQANIDRTTNEFIKLTVARSAGRSTPEQDERFNVLQSQRQIAQQQIEQNNVTLESAKERINKAAKAEQEAQARTNLIAKDAELDRESQVRDAVRKFNEEDNAEAVRREDKKLQATRGRLAEESALMQEQLKTADDVEKVYLEERLRRNQAETQKNDEIIAQTRRKVDEAEQQKKFEEQRKQFEKAGKEEAEELDREILELRQKVETNNEKQQDLQKEVELAGQAAGSSAGNVRGTSAGTSAVNRAIAGTSSKENDTRAMIKELQEIVRNQEKQLKQSQFKRAELKA